MAKLKAFEIDAIVTTIMNQVQAKMNDRKELREADKDPKLLELQKTHKEVYALYDKVRLELEHASSDLRKREIELKNQLAKKLKIDGAYGSDKAYVYCSHEDGRFYVACNGFFEIRSRVILSQISSDMEQTIKDIVADLTSPK